MLKTDNDQTDICIKADQGRANTDLVPRAFSLENWEGDWEGGKFLKEKALGMRLGENEYKTCGNLHAFAIDLLIVCSFE